MSRDYLTVDDVLAIHAEQIERYGGAEGLRDYGQLEAAVARPRSGYYADICGEAAALWESLSQNHPFVDGNKRMAFSAMYRFLALNDVVVAADADEAWGFLSRAYEEREVVYSMLKNWLTKNTMVRTQRGAGL